MHVLIAARTNSVCHKGIGVFAIKGYWSIWLIDHLLPLLALPEAFSFTMSS